MLLSRAREAGKIDVSIGIISISIKVNFRDQMTERVKSSLGHDEFIFDPYDGEQLRQILENRSDAFKEGILNSGVIPKTAALAAQRHGDARKAIRLLRHAGDYAKNNNIGELKEIHLELAQEQAEGERLKELIAGLPPHSKYVLYALANLTAKNDNESDSQEENVEASETEPRLSRFTGRMIHLTEQFVQTTEMAAAVVVRVVDHRYSRRGPKRQIPVGAVYEPIRKHQL